MSETSIFYPTSLAAWEEWLSKNHLSETAVWLVFHTKASGKFSLSWSEAVDVALCYGWIDSKKIKIDAETSHQFFSQRKPNSTWSKINKEKVRQLIESGQMKQAGYESIETAKRNGSWSILDEVEELIIPHDLKAEFDKYPESQAYFESLSKSVRKMLLQWLVLAKRPETRQQRIREIAVNAGQKKKPNSFEGIVL